MLIPKYGCIWCVNVVSFWDWGNGLDSFNKWKLPFSLTMKNLSSKRSICIYWGVRADAGFPHIFLAGFTSDHTCIESTLYTLNTWVVWSENRQKSESCICGNPAWALTSPPYYNYVCANFCRNLKTWKRCFSHAGENVGLVHLHSSRFVLIYLDSLCYTTGHHPTTSRKRHYVL